MSPRALIVVIVLLLPALAHAEVRLLRHPSYAKDKVAFSYLGDIWIANGNGSGVERLTVHAARDIYPRFSPDGNWLAFSSNRDGNYDVYVMAVRGGKPRQLTFHTADDNLVGWTPDGRNVLFSSSRGKGAFPNVATLFEISREGGMEQPLPTDWGSWGSYSHDGSKLAFTRHPGTWWRKHYRGSAAVDLWLMDVAGKRFTKLGDEEYKGNYLWPMYGRNGEIYFVSDRLPNERTVKFGGPEVMKSVNNIWKISEQGGKPVQVTHHTSGNLFFPTISADGGTIVYEENFGLWKLDVASGKSTPIAIDITSDVKESDTQLMTVQSEAQGFNLSPSTKRAAIATRGEIFTIATERGEVQRVTETFWREQDPRWSPDGKWIAFVSDRTGRQEVWIADERGQNLKQLSNEECDKPALTWAPDSKSLLWAGSDRRLRRVDIDTNKTDVLATADVGAIGTPQFSPDGKWISYSKVDRLLRSHVYIKPLDGGAERMIDAGDFLLSSGAKWTPDGKKLLLLGGFGAPQMSALNRTNLQLYSVSLTPLDQNPDDRGIDTEAQAMAADAARRASATATGGRPPAKVDVKIEWDGLERRIRQLTRMSDSITNVVPSPDGRTYALIVTSLSVDAPAVPALYTVAEDGTRLTRTTTVDPADQGAGRTAAPSVGVAEPQWSNDGRSIFYLQDERIYSVAVPSAPAGESAAGVAPPAGGIGGATPAASPAPSSRPQRVAFTVRFEVDKTVERRQVFEEAWRVMKNRFYDPAMHGVNWAAAKTTYQALLDNIEDSDELRTVILQMIGELNASHTGMTAPPPAPGEEPLQTRYPGFDLEPDASGHYKVSHVYRKGPADHHYVRVAPGHYIVAVNGKELKPRDNYWKLFNLVPGRKFEFTVNAKPQLEGGWTVSLEPLTQTAQTDLEYERWVDTRESMVSKLSNGEIGYLHIRGMNAPSFQKFQRDLLENLHKKALIIDERFNGGGGIDQELLGILNQRRKYESYRARDSVEIPRPVQAFFGPMVVLQNERSGSNAEMFPEGFRTLGLGKLIGMPTAGGVIGTGSYRMLDGSTIRTPGTGVYTSRGENFENYGVVPDVLIDNTPADFLAGRDRQLEKAIEVLRADMTGRTSAGR